MTLRVPNASEERFLDLILAADYTLRLFTNDVAAGLTETQMEALATGSFTEATFPGYAAATLTGGSWTTTPGDTESVAMYAQQTFTRSSTGGGQTVRGYYVTNPAASDALVWWEYFDGPIIVTNAGDAIVITPTFTLDDNKEAAVAAGGIVRQFAAAFSSAALTVDTVTDMVLSNVPVVAGRTYAFHFHSDVNLSAALGDWAFDLQVNGVTVDRLVYVQNVAATSENRTADGVCYWTAPATQATDDFQVLANEIGGTASLTLLASATNRRTFTVHDVGVL